jgi:putative acetyltransferase
MSLVFRPIRPADDAQVAHIIRTVMTEFGAVGTGFSIEDPEVDAMSAAYDAPRASYWVLENTELGTLAGCGGIAPLQGGDADTCELKKMYFLPEARGVGKGRELIDLLEKMAIERGFKHMYLETIERMAAANRLYQRAGFEPLAQQLGHTGHSACGLFYQKMLG